MSNDHQGPPLHRGSRRRVVLLVVVALAIVVLGYVVWRSNSRFEAALAEAREIGLPTSIEELKAMRPVVPDERNAALVYQNAFDAVTGKEEVRNEGRVPLLSMAKAPDDPREPLPEEMLAASREYIERQSLALELLSESSRLPESSYPWQISDSAFLPHLSRVRDATRLLVVAAWVEAEDSKGDSALERVREGLAVGGSIDGEPILMSKLVASATRSIAVGGLKRVLARSHPSDGALAALQRDLHQSAARLTFNDVIKGEFALFCDLCTGGTGGMPVESARDDNLVQRWGRSWIFRRQLVDSMPAFRAALESVETPTPANLRATAPSGLAPLGRMTATLSSSLMDSMQRGRVAVEHARAKLLAAEAAVAALRFFNDNGRLPASLDELVPQYLATVPIDPFTGQPLVFLQTDDGVMIYTVYYNGVDDGGYPYLITPPEGPDRRNWKREYDDAGFRLVLPTAQRETTPSGKVSAAGGEAE